MNKNILIAIVLIIVVSVAGFFAFNYFKPNINNSVNTNQTKIGSGILIGFSMGTLQEERWQRDRVEFLKRADELGATVDLEASNNDAAKQISQIEGMILKKVDVLVIAPYDAGSLAGVIAEAHKAGIKVISYDRLVTKSDADYYISFDGVKVGQYQADYILNLFKDKMSKGKPIRIAYIGGSTTDNNALLFKSGAFKELQPKIDSGEVKIVLDKFTPNWDPENAYKNLKAYLDQSNGAIDAVVAANDGTAFGAIKALAEHKLDGKIPVSGQDAELAALQRIVAGTQSMTVYKPIPALASAGVELAIKVAKGDVIDKNAMTNDGIKDVPSILLESVSVDKNNIDATVVKDGYYAHSDIYKAN
jgi:D-xylose transport system substrate-binding protein